MNQLNTFSIPNFIKESNEEYYDCDICARCGANNDTTTLFMIELDMVCVRCIEEFRAEEEKFWYARFTQKEIDKKRKQEEDMQKKKRDRVYPYNEGFPTAP